MNPASEHAAVVVGALIAVLLQIALAPNIAIFSAMPNFLLAYVMVVAIARPHAPALTLAFVLGLVANLIGSGPVGSLAFLFVLMAFLASRAFLVLDNDTLFMPLALLAVSALLIELLYSAFLVGLAIDVSPLDAFVYRALPCALYDCVASLIMYPLVTRFVMAPPATPGSMESPRLR